MACASRSTHCCDPGFPGGRQPPEDRRSFLELYTLRSSVDPKDHLRGGRIAGTQSSTQHCDPWPAWGLVRHHLGCCLGGRSPRGCDPRPSRRTSTHDYPALGGAPPVVAILGRPGGRPPLTGRRWKCPGRGCDPRPSRRATATAMVRPISCGSSMRLRSSIAAWGDLKTCTPQHYLLGKMALRSLIAVENDRHPPPGSHALPPRQAAILGRHRRRPPLLGPVDGRDDVQGVAILGHSKGRPPLKHRLLVLFGRAGVAILGRRSRRPPRRRGRRVHQEPGVVILSRRRK